MCKGFGCPLDCRSEMGKWSAVELLRWAVFQRGNSGWGTRRGNFVLASWWKHPAWGFPQHCFLEIQPGAKGNGLEVPCLFYIPELQHRPGVCTPKLCSTEKMGQFGDFFFLDTPHYCFVPHKWERNREGFHGTIINFATCHLISYIDSDWVLGNVSVRNGGGVDVKEPWEPRSPSLVATALWN